MYLFCIKNDLANRHHQEKTLKTFFVVFDSDKPYNLKGMNSSIDHLKQKNTIRKLQLTSGNKKKYPKMHFCDKKNCHLTIFISCARKGEAEKLFYLKTL